MFYRTLGICMLASMLLCGALYGLNERTTVVLHAHSYPDGLECDAWQEAFDCSPGNGPTVTVEPGDLVAIVVLLRNHDQVQGVECAFQVAGGSGPGMWGDWVMGGTLIGCVSNQGASRLPDTHGGDLSTSFDCIAGGTLENILRMYFWVGSVGCLTVVEPTLGPAGVFACEPAEFTTIPASNRGRICVGPGGYNACEPVSVPVRAQTWGAIKGQYH